MAENEVEVRKRAKAELLNGAQSVHTDDLYDIDDCLKIAEVDGQHIYLEPTMEKSTFDPQNGYHVIPQDIVSGYAARRGF